MSKIEQLIGEIEEFIDGCKLQPFSSTKIVVDKAQLEDLLVELQKISEDFKQQGCDHQRCKAAGRGYYQCCKRSDKRDG